MTGAAAVVRDHRLALRPAGSRSGRRTIALHWAIVLFVAGAVALGAAMRVWDLVHDPINADQALIGIEARQILAGHLHAFLPGLHYEAVEPYLVAAVFALAGPSALALNIPVMACEAVACILVWRTALRVSDRRDIAAICAAAMWVAPQSALWNSTMEYGFRGVTLVCGTAMVLLALRLYQGSARWWDAPLLGALAGVGWWSSPEIVYFGLPSLLLVAGWLWRARTERGALARRAVGAAGGLLAAGVGALPWLWDNVTSGFPSLAVSTFDAPGVVAPYAARLGDFFGGALPMVLDLRVPRSGAWDMPSVLGIGALVVLGGAVAAAAMQQLWSRGDGFAVGAAVLAYPFILAAAPASVGWQSGRYTNFLVPLLAVLAAATLADLSHAAPAGSHASGARALGGSRFLRVPVLLVGTLTAGVVATSLVAFVDLGEINVLPGSRLGASPEQPAQRLVSALERAGIRGGYADYWVAYKLDFLSLGRLKIDDAPPSPDRLASLGASIRSLPASEQAWLFVTPTPTARTEYADTAIIRGPSGLTLPAFVADAKAKGVRCRVVRLGGAEAVVCRRPVTPAEIGMQ